MSKKTSNTNNLESIIIDFTSFLNKYYKIPNIVLIQLSNTYKLKYDDLMNSYLDYYNIILKQTYNQIGENSTDFAYKEYYMKEALYWVLKDIMSKVKPKVLLKQIT